jgi:excinuclease ABC subunit C
MENLVSEYIFQRLSELPLLPGVYLMKNSRGKIIYIGKAKVLKNRVRSYFDGREHIGHRAASLMLPHIHDIEWIITESEREALILEANLVRKHTPIYNVRLKDDKHFPYIKVDMHEPFPRLEVTRSVKNDGAMYFGPYMGTRVIRQLVELSARLFKIRECTLKLPAANGKPCLNYHIGRCLGPCAN